MKKIKQSKYLRSPQIEMIILIVSVLLAYGGLAMLSVASDAGAAGEMTIGTIALILFAFFMLSVVIAMLSVIAGIGGGVIFTPIMLAFTDINSLVIRGTGLIVAMFSGPISTGIFIRKGLVNYRLSLVMILSQALGALAGANLAIATAAGAGETGEGLMRFALGVILLMLAIYFLSGGKNLEWPAIKKVDKLTQNLKLDGQYYEESEAVVKNYRVRRAPLGMVLVFFVGVLGGFFGMGGGWAIVPSLNLGMGLPLKLAAANSNVILAVGSGVSIWPYIFAGSVIPFFVLPWATGQIVGGFIGAYVLARIKVRIVRVILIGVMIFTSFGLVTRGLEMLQIIGRTPAIVQVMFLLATVLVVIVVLMLSKARRGKDVSSRS